MKKNRIRAVLLNKLFVAIWLLPLTIACTDRYAKQYVKDSFSEKALADLDYVIDFTDFRWTQNADSLITRFRIVDKKLTNKKLFWEDLSIANMKVEEFESSKQPKLKELSVLSGENDQDRISKNALFSLIVDRSNTVAAEEIDNIKKTVQNIVSTMPDSTVYISFMDNKLSEKKLISKDNFFLFENEFQIKPYEKNLYKFISEAFYELAKRNSSEKESESIRYLIVFTDGKVNINSAETPMAIAGFIQKIDEIDSSDEYNNVIIHTFRYGNDASNDNTLDHISNKARKTDVKGEFYPAERAEDIVNRFAEFKDDLSADYELILENPSKKIYNGQELFLKIFIEKNKNEAIGIKKYVIGSKERPVITGSTKGGDYLTIFWGLIVLFVAFFIMQVIIPYLTHKIKNFEKKHLISYEPDEEILETCSVCQDILLRGDKVVTVCAHKTHWECWKENGYKCVEYGQNCSEGIQHYFDKDHPFDLSKSPYYLKWAMSGMVGGLITWLIYKICFDLNPFLFQDLSNTLLSWFYQGELKADVQFGFVQKIGGFLLTGTLLGFILTLLFAYTNEFRQKNVKIIIGIIYRALLGAILGFIAFLIGSIICILLNAYANNALIDWIPWMLFGAFIGLCLSIKTTIKWQHALIGGILSGILSFIVLYSTHFFGTLGVLLGFMLCSAGLGISIVTVHHVAQRYFLKYKSDKKSGEIAIHKWMSVLGGSNEVTIGKSNDSIIQMNWDTDPVIQDKHVKLYLDKKRNVPMLKVLEDGVSIDGRNAQKNNEYVLKDNFKFTIGNTDFFYVERR